MTRKMPLPVTGLLGDDQHEALFWQRFLTPDNYLPSTQTAAWLWDIIFFWFDRTNHRIANTESSVEYIKQHDKFTTQLFGNIATQNDTDHEGRKPAGTKEIRQSHDNPNGYVFLRWRRRKLYEFFSHEDTHGTCGCLFVLVFHGWQWRGRTEKSNDKE